MRNESPERFSILSAPFLPVVGSAVKSFLPRSVPRMSRPNYRRELSASFLLPWMLAGVEGGVMGVVVKNAYDGVVSDRMLNLAVATISAAPALANIVSFIWTRLSHGRDKVRFLQGLQLGIAVLVGLLSLVPTVPWGLHALMVLIISARLCFAGVVTLRSTVWAANYPQRTRAQITGRLTTIQVGLVAMSGLLIGLGMQWQPWSFRVLTPVFALLGIAGALQYGKTRVRNRRRLMIAEQTMEASETPSLNPVSLWQVMWRDKVFGMFMLLQMLLGLGNLMINPVLIVMLKDRFAFAHLAVIITHTIPLVMMPVCIPMWAKLMDRMHIVWFRAIHSWTFVLGAAAYLAAGLLMLPELLYVGAVCRGLAFGGGALAWSLGHLDFAPPEKASQYMSVHVTLTGIRGLIAPLIGIEIYMLLESVEKGQGAWTFGVATGLIVVGAIGFLFLGRFMRQKNGALGKPVQE